MLSLTSNFFNQRPVETMDGSEDRGMIPIAMTLIYHFKEDWLSHGSNQHRPQILESGQM